MIRTLDIDGFKSIHSESISLGRVNCLIGANGVGKSNVLEALGVLGAAANGVVDDEALLRRGVRAGLPRLFKSSFAEERTPVHIGVGVTDDRQASYRVSLLNPLESPEPAWSYKTEVLTDGVRDIVSDGVRNKKNLNPQAGLAALKLVDEEPTNPAAQLMQRLQDYAIYCPNTPTLRGTVPDTQPRSPVGLSGGQLAEAFDELSKLYRDDERGTLDSVLELIDWVSGVEATSKGADLLSPKVPRTKWLLKFTDRYMKTSRNELTAYDASEGALYVIFCAVLCLLPKGPKLFAIDNLDQALNPRLVARLTARLSEWLSVAASDKQLIFTAHNPAVLDGLDLSDPEIRLFAVERDNTGKTCVRRIEVTPELLTLRADYPLSRLWLMGHLGAVPNV
ncbi:MAG: AAA family ATPase [Hydrogenophaga sp.]|jgi:predicted ATPase|uniref:AAA family ATPase n=1 Tax=Hydrogenophaga aromaticivorans TaxID=2610898 RepID=A0A7Y8KW00_9BURK|nr:ATP-binding protein [Hydrogenophaga aromaticivorans]MDP3926715.1 AAA family ATPase [Hydrogenophaga sp.]MDZ4237591.1 AAA family ATPase [Hydrogenophaga sp.]NWF44910.1 AAA family ATPase [Hydrogenophaga aromaticivorans]